MKIQLSEAPEIPVALEEKIRTAARRKAQSFRRRRIWMRRIFPAAAAAAALLVTGVFLWNDSAKPGIAKVELLALNDWSKIEQESYNLSFEIFSNTRALEEYAGSGTVGGLTL